MTRESKPSNVSTTIKMVRGGKSQNMIQNTKYAVNLNTFVTQVFAHSVRDNKTILPCKLEWGLS